MRSRSKTITLRLGRRRDPSTGLARELTPDVLHSQSLLQTPQPLIVDILHDLKSPLARMNVALGLARQKSNPGAQDALDRIELEAERLNQMLQQLFDLAQVEAEAVASPDLMPARRRNKLHPSTTNRCARPPTCASRSRPASPSVVAASRATT